MKKVGGKWNKVRRSVYPFEKILGYYQVKVAKEYCKGNSLLDLGCGEGVVTAKFRKNFKRIVGVDGTSSQISLAKSKHKGIEFIHCNIEEFETEERFDCVLLLFILEHVDNPHQLIKIAKKFVKKGGFIHIHVPNVNSLNRRLGKIMGLLKHESELHEHDIDSGHKRMFDLKSLIQLVKSNNLQILHSGGIFLKAHPNHQMQILYDSNMWENESIKKRYFDALFKMGKQIPEYSSTIYVHCRKN